jgi:hypothetical protein
MNGSAARLISSSLVVLAGGIMAQSDMYIASIAAAEIITLLLIVIGVLGWAVEMVYSVRVTR